MKALAFLSTRPTSAFERTGRTPPLQATRLRLRERDAKIQVNREQSMVRVENAERLNYPLAYRPKKKGDM